MDAADVDVEPAGGECLDTFEISVSLVCRGVVAHLSCEKDYEFTLIVCNNYLERKTYVISCTQPSVREVSPDMTFYVPQEGHASKAKKGTGARC